MKVSGILRVKGNTLFTVTPDEPLARAVDIMAEKDIGSLVVMEHGELVGMLTFREVIQSIVKNGGTLGSTQVRSSMDDHPLTCTTETEIDEVRRMMLERHARYMPVMDKKMLMGVISFYDVAKFVVESQSFENKMLKAYIHDWPADESDGQGRIRRALIPGSVGPEPRSLVGPAVRGQREAINPCSRGSLRAPVGRSAGSTSCR
jgi:CBS domain-containing protein